MHRIDMKACTDINMFQKSNVFITDCRLLIQPFSLWTKMWRCRESQGHTGSDSRSRFEYQCHGYVERMEDQQTTYPRKFWRLENISLSVGAVVGLNPDLTTELLSAPVVKSIERERRINIIKSHSLIKCTICGIE